LILWYGIIQRKLYEDAQNISYECLDSIDKGLAIIRKGIDNMKKIVFDRKPEKPKNLKEFWDIFVKSCGNISENENELEKEQAKSKKRQCDLITKLEKIKRHNRIPIVIAIVVATITGINTTLYLQEVALHRIEVNELLEGKISYVVANEEIEWTPDYQLYMLHFENKGEKEDNLLIEVKFPSNCSINHSQPLGCKTQLIINNITQINTLYTAFYSNIHENQFCSVRLDVYNSDLINNPTLKIHPSYVRAWTTKGQVKINYDNG